MKITKSLWGESIAGVPWALHLSVGDKYHLLPQCPTLSPTSCHPFIGYEHLISFLGQRGAFVPACPRAKQMGHFVATAASELVSAQQPQPS